MNSSNHYDGIIVGGGPAGSSCATLLAKRGLRVLICDKAKFPREKICGDCINPANWKLLEWIGVSESLRMKELSKITRIRIANKQGQQIEANIDNNPEQPFFAIKRSVFDHLLLRNAQRYGAEVKEETRVINIHRRNSWTVETINEDSLNKEIFTSQFLVGADGRNSLIARILTGSKKEDDSERVGIQWHTDRQPQLNSSVEMFLFDSGYGGVVNVSDQFANVAMVTSPRLAQFARTNFSKFITETLFANRNARRRFESLQPIGEIRTANPINPQNHYLTHADAFLIGDAHQTVEPFTGEGVLYALQDGVEVAQKILSRYHLPSILPANVTRRRFWVNHVYSPVLQNQWLAKITVALGSKMPFMMPRVLNTVFKRTQNG